MADLAGKVAVVTGGARGIGREESLHLAQCGAAVIINGRPASASVSHASRLVEEILAAGGRATAHHGDISDWKSAEELIELAISEYGRLDILVCNAGVVRDRMLVNLSEAEWDEVIAVNLKGHFAALHFAARHWKSVAPASNGNTGGAVIFTLSEAGLFGNLGQANYSASKAGIMGLCFNAAKELARYGVTVNAISPRGRTPMTEAAFGAFRDIDGFDAWDPAHVAPLVSFLGGSQARQITGQVFVVFGDTIQHISPSTVAAEVRNGGAWTSASVADAVRRMIPVMAAAPPSMPDIAVPA